MRFTWEIIILYLHPVYALSANIPSTVKYFVVVDAVTVSMQEMEVFRGFEDTVMFSVDIKCDDPSSPLINAVNSAIVS